MAEPKYPDTREGFCKQDRWVGRVLERSAACPREEGVHFADQDGGGNGGPVDAETRTQLRDKKTHTKTGYVCEEKQLSVAHNDSGCVLSKRRVSHGNEQTMVYTKTSKCVYWQDCVNTTGCNC